MSSDQSSPKATATFLGRLVRRKLRRDQSGATAVEFGLIALPFFTIIFAIIEVGLAMLVNRLVDNAVIEASRIIRTGQANAAGFSAGNPDDFANEVCNSLPSFLCKPEKIRVNVSTAADFVNIPSLDTLYDDEGNLNDDNGYADSEASEIVVVNVIYTWPMFTSFLNFSELDHGNERHLSSTMVFRNEPYN